MRILAIDTALGACSACILSAEDREPLAKEMWAMERGHAEALIPLIEQIESRVPGGFASLTRIAVTIGPGSYTGLRVGVSAARAIGLATGMPVVGVSTLSALMAPIVAQESGRLAAAAIDARHGHVYFQAVARGGKSVVPAGLYSIRDAIRQIGSSPVTLSGSAAPIIAAEAWAVGLEAKVFDAPLGPDVTWVARLGLIADPKTALPRPLYLRGADATPQDHVRLPRR